MRRQYGSESIVGFTVIDSLDDLSPKVIESAEEIPGLFGDGQWGGCNQACYTAMAFVMNPETREVRDYQIIGTRKLFEPHFIKKPNLADCVFPSGIVMRQDGKVQENTISSFENFTKNSS